MAKVMFLQQIWFPAQAVTQLSAELKRAGHQANVAIGTTEENLWRQIKKYNPDIIAVPIITSFRKFMLSVTKYVRKKGYEGKIVLGGYDASFSPEVINEFTEADVLCRGEGDEAFVDLANAIDKKEDYSHIKNLWVRKSNGEIVQNELRTFSDVNKKAWDDRDIYRNYHEFFKDLEFELIMVGRGCPWKCTYCYNHTYAKMYKVGNSQYVQLRNPQNVIDEILMIKRKYKKVKNIFFNDSDLTCDKKWIMEFCRLFNKNRINMPFTLNAVASEIDEDIAKALASTKSCYLIRFGLETGSQELRFKMRKTVTDEQFRKCTNLLKKYKIKYSMQAMMGLPYETLNDAFKTLDFAIELSNGRKSLVAMNLFTPFPKLDIVKDSIESGQFDAKEISDTNEIGDNGRTFVGMFRTDPEGKKILMLSRFCQLYLNFPFLRKWIRNHAIYQKDNFAYQMLWRLSDYYYTSRHHVNASIPWLVKYILFYRNLSARGS